MKGFIEVTAKASNIKLLVNINHIVAIDNARGGTRLFLSSKIHTDGPDTPISISQSFETVKTLIANAQY